MPELLLLLKAGLVVAAAVTPIRGGGNTRGAAAAAGGGAARAGANGIEMASNPSSCNGKCRKRPGTSNAIKMLVAAVTSLKI
jgi:hypothetical protein